MTKKQGILIPKPYKTPELSLIDLFAGCGGLSLGLEQAGFTPIFVNELNDHARKSYLCNRTEIFPWLSKLNNSDIKELVLKRGTLSEMKRDIKALLNLNLGKKKSDLDLLVGGPPCQGYSGIGHRRSYSVEKEQLPSNHLYQDMAYVISKLNPKIFLFENVRGLLNSKWRSESNKKIWDDVLKTFNDIPSYKVRWALVHCKDYGIPQNRPRLLLVGVRDDLNIKITDNDSLYLAGGLLPKAEDVAALPPNIEDLLSDLVDDAYSNGGETNQYTRSPLSPIQKELRTKADGSIMEKGSPLSEQKYSKHSEKILEKFSYMISNNGLIREDFQTNKFAQRVLPAQWGPKGPNITATSLPDDYVHWIQPRILTVREWARLQTFPDWYQFHGPRTTGGLRRAGNPQEELHKRDLPRYTQIANAVPVQLGKILGYHFKTLLHGTR